MTINISTETELRNYTTGINNGTITEGAELLNDIVLTGGDWVPFEDFAYEFDGKGHTISGVVVNTAATGAGFFNSTANNNPTTVKVKNLKVSGAINCPDATNVGGIIGYVTTKTEITNCRFSGTINGKRIIGGIIGLVGSNGAKSVVARCQVEATITSSEPTLNPYTSGIVGYCYGKTISQHNAFFGSLNTQSTNYGGVSGIGYLVDGIMTACVAKATNSTTSGTNKHGLAYGLFIFNDSFYNSDTFGVYDAAGACSDAVYTTQSTFESFGNFDFVNMWEMDPSDGPILREVADYTYVPITDFPADTTPSTQPTTLKFHAVRDGDITPTLTFTGGPIEVFTETSQVGSVTNYTSQGTFTSGSPKTISLTIGQRLYFAIPTGTSITAIDFTGDQITGTLDSEAIQTSATIDLTNSGWRRYYLEKTLEYLDSAGFTGTFTATGTPGIFTDTSLTARTNLITAGAAITCNLAQKGPGTYNFTTSFRSTAANQQFTCTFTRGTTAAITSVTAVIKNSGGTVVHTLTPAVSGNTFTINQSITAIDSYTVEWTFEVGATGINDHIDISFLNGYVKHTFDTKDIPPQLIRRFFYIYSLVSVQNEFYSDISDLSEQTGSSARTQIMGSNSPNENYRVVGSINTFKPRAMINFQHLPNVYGDIGLNDWSLTTHFDCRRTHKLIGDVDILKNCAANVYQLQHIDCQGLYGSIQNWKAVVQTITGSSNITGPINSVVTTNVNSTRSVYGSGITVEQIEESIARLYNAGFVYKGSFNARGTGYGAELATSNPTTLSQITSLIAGGANIQVKAIAASYDFNLSCHAEVGDRYNLSISPTTAFSSLKITFPAGAFVRTSNSAPITEWTENLSPDVTCVVAGDYDIRWQFDWDGVTLSAGFFYNGTGTGSMHTFDISVIPDAAIATTAGFAHLPNITGDIAKCAVASTTVGIQNATQITGNLSTLTKQTLTNIIINNTNVSGQVAGGAANCNYSLYRSKMTKTDIAKSLIWLNERDPIFIGQFTCDTDMPAVTDKAGIAAYDALVARLGASKVLVNIDRDFSGHIPATSAGRLTSSPFSRLSGMRRF